VIVGDGGCEAYTAIVWGAIEPRKLPIAEAEAVDSAEGNMGSAATARRCRSAVVEDPVTHEWSTSEPERSRVRPGGRWLSRSASGRR
jgi:hypothetical protein